MSSGLGSYLHMLETMAVCKIHPKTYLKQNAMHFSQTHTARAIITPVKM